MHPGRVRSERTAGRGLRVAGYQGLQRGRDGGSRKKERGRARDTTWGTLCQTVSYGGCGCADSPDRCRGVRVDRARVLEAAVSRGAEIALLLTLWAVSVAGFSIGFALLIDRL